jgi:nucleoside 2-deoxyribosyltransferase
MKVYVASSWKQTNNHADVVDALRAAGHEVYDYRNPSPGDHGCSWRQIDPAVTTMRSRWWAALHHHIAAAAYAKDMNALDDADAVVMVLPCGKSAHMELAYGVGQGKIGIILADQYRDEPELLYNMADICQDMGEVLDLLGER